MRATSPFYEIGEVYANEEIVIKGSLGYSFIMPEEDVLISVDMKEVGEYDDLDDHLSWGESVSGKILSLTEEELESDIPYTQDLKLVFNGVSSANWITIIDDAIYSSNQDVIPDDALRFEPITASSSNAIIGGKIVVDLTKVSVGTTYIYISLDPNNFSLGTLIKEFEVVAPDVPIYETMDVTFTFTNDTDYNIEN